MEDNLMKAVINSGQERMIMVNGWRYSRNAWKVYNVHSQNCCLKVHQ